MDWLKTQGNVLWDEEGDSDSSYDDESGDESWDEETWDDGHDDITMNTEQSHAARVQAQEVRLSPDSVMKSERSRQQNERLRQRSERSTGQRSKGSFWRAGSRNDDMGKKRRSKLIGNLFRGVSQKMKRSSDKKKQGELEEESEVLTTALYEEEAKRDSPSPIEEVLSTPFTFDEDAPIMIRKASEITYDETMKWTTHVCTSLDYMDSDTNSLEGYEERKGSSSVRNRKLMQKLAKKKRQKPSTLGLIELHNILGTGQPTSNGGKTASQPGSPSSLVRTDTTQLIGTDTSFCLMRKPFQREKPDTATDSPPLSSAKSFERTATHEVADRSACNHLGGGVEKSLELLTEDFGLSLLFGRIPPPKTQRDQFDQGSVSEYSNSTIPVQRMSTDAYRYEI